MWTPGNIKTPLIEVNLGKWFKEQDKWDTLYHFIDCSSAVVYLYSIYLSGHSAHFVWTCMDTNPLNVSLQFSQIAEQTCQVPVLSWVSVFRFLVIYLHNKVISNIFSRIYTLKCFYRLSCLMRQWDGRNFSSKFLFNFDNITLKKCSLYDDPQKSF